MLISQVMQFVEPSREVLAETLLAAGPGAETLCDGWRTQELAAHLYLREHNPRAGLGMVFKPWKKATDKAIAKLAAETSSTESFAALVEKFRAGPPKISPFALKAVDHTANLTEFFIHTEDVRRASDRWAPRSLDPDYSQALWAELLKRAAFLYRSVDLGIVLVNPQGHRHVAKRAPVSVAIIGDPGELLLHANGRTGQSLVSFEGQPDAVALLQTATVGL